MGVRSLIVLGKFKGEINGAFTMYYVGVDRAGGYWTNPSPSMNASSNLSTEGWTKTSNKQVDFYKKELAFIPSASEDPRVLKGIVSLLSARREERRLDEGMGI